MIMDLSPSTDPTLGSSAGRTMGHESQINGQAISLSTCYGFLNIPREIRDLVYGIMFISEEPIYPSRDRASVAPYMNMLRANKQIYSEILPFLYGKNTFQIRGFPAYRCPEFLNLLYSQRRQGLLHLPLPTPTPELCLARHHLRRLNIPSYGIKLERVKHLFSLMKHFPNLEHIQLVYHGNRFTPFDVVDMDVINVCRLLKDRLPLLNITLLKRITLGKAEDVSWTLSRPFVRWMPSLKRPASEHCWISPDAPYLSHHAIVVSAPQKMDHE
jgi:hypothetical protein